MQQAPKTVTSTPIFFIVFLKEPGVRTQRTGEICFHALSALQKAHCCVLRSCTRLSWQHLPQLPRFGHAEIIHPSPQTQTLAFSVQPQNSFCLFNELLRCLCTENLLLILLAHVGGETSFTVTVTTTPWRKEKTSCTLTYYRCSCTDHFTEDLVLNHTVP